MPPKTITIDGEQWEFVNPRPVSIQIKDYNIWMVIGRSPSDDDEFHVLRKLPKPNPMPELKVGDAVGINDPPAPPWIVIKAMHLDGFTAACVDFAPRFFAFNDVRSISRNGSRIWTRNPS